MSGDQVETTRRQVLAGLGGEGEVLDEVLAYCANGFDPAQLPEPPVLPLADEPHLEDWRGYAAACGERPLEYLQERLPQLAVPIAAGVSERPEYRAISRRGEPFREEPFGGRLTLERPQEFALTIHESAVGGIPILSTHHRPDFETLARALAHRSEPAAINPAVFAQTVAGFNNWDRVFRYRAEWEAEAPQDAVWSKELGRVAREEPWRFRDRFMILCAGPYSGVSAAELGLDLSEEVWVERSLQLRIEHELTHYATKRLYGRWSLNLLDETICDWVGLAKVLGRFEAAHFLRFLGLEAHPAVRETGRMHEYRGELSAPAFELLAALVVAAASGLEQLSAAHHAVGQETRMFLALTRMTLELLASEERETFFGPALAEADRLLATATR